MRHIVSVVSSFAILIGLLVSVFFVRPAQAEWYVAGQGGVSFSNSFNSVEGVGSLTGFTLSDLDLHKSAMYGAKLGYYLDSMSWLGIEMEAFSSTPHVKQQQATGRFLGLSTRGTLSGQDLRGTNWAPMNVVVRYQLGPREPDAGVGLGVFFARVHDAASGESSSSNLRPGLNTQVGLRWRMTKNLSVFGEWKYNRATFNFGESSPTQETGGFKGNYSAHIAAGGLAWHF